MLPYSERYPLHDSVKRAHPEDVKILLEKDNVVVDAKDSAGFTPFALACQSANVGLMRSLLEAGADPHQRFHFLKRLTAAHFACTTANKEMLELMIHFGVSANETVDGLTLLATAVYANREGVLDVVQLLLNNGAEVDAVDVSIPINGKAALHVAFERGNMDVVQLLLEFGASANVRARDGRTPLCFACENHAVGPEPIEFLFQYEAEVDCSDPDTSPLLAVLKSGREDGQKVELLNLLVSHGADVESRATQTGPSPLNLAVASGFVESAQQLLALGASPNVPAAEHNWTSLHICTALCGEGRFQIAKSLLDAEAAVNAGDATWNETPLFTAIYSVFDERVNKVERLSLVKLLLSRGADVNWRNNGGRTPLHHACCNQLASNWQSVIRVLLDEGADPSTCDNEGETPLHFATDGGPDVTTVDRGYAEAAHTLLAYGADLEVTSDRGATPMLKALDDDRPETMDEMIEYKLDYLPHYG